MLSLVSNFAKGEEENDYYQKDLKYKLHCQRHCSILISGLLRIERFLLCAVLTLMVIILLFYLRDRHFGRPNSVRNRAHRRRAQSH